jgi:hypothetical protein
MNRVAVMDIGECLHAPQSWFVALRYRGRDLKVFTGVKDEVGTLIQQAHKYALNRGFTNTRQNWLRKL